MAYARLLRNSISSADNVLTENVHESVAAPPWLPSDDAQ
jgi:hypothetical protein